MRVSGPLHPVMGLREPAGFLGGGCGGEVNLLRTVHYL